MFVCLPSKEFCRDRPCWPLKGLYLSDVGWKDFFRWYHVNKDIKVPFVGSSEGGQRIPNIHVSSKNLCPNIILLLDKKLGRPSFVVIGSGNNILSHNNGKDKYSECIRFSFPSILLQVLACFVSSTTRYSRCKSWFICDYSLIHLVLSSHQVRPESNSFCLNSGGNRVCSIWKF